MISSRSLAHKRILITDVESEFGHELYLACRGEGALILTLVRELCRLSGVLKAFPDVVPIVLDPSDGDKSASIKLLSSLPALDHIVNLAGEDGLDIISRAWPSWKIHDFAENATKPLLSKMKDAGDNKCLIFHSSVGNQNLMSKLKANLNPRYTDSATAVVSTSLRKSFKKFFTSEPPTVTPTSNGSGSQSLASGNSHATEFAAIASSLARDSPPSSSNSSPRATPAPQGPLGAGGGSVLTLAEKNEKIRQVMVKLGQSTTRKWGQLLKDLEKEQLSALKALDKSLKTLAKTEKNALMAQNSAANAATAARSDVLSADTSARILASREARVDREVDKKVESRRDADTVKIAEDKKTRMAGKVKKLYDKTLIRERNELDRIKVKYLM